MKYKVAFVCTANSCRSQMAEGWAKNLGSDIFEVYSAGTHPAAEVNADAVAVMKEVGIDISDQFPKSLDDIPFEMDILIKMGCDVVCPFVMNRHEEDWELPDPVGYHIDEFRRVRDLIKNKVIDLIDRVKKNQIVELTSNSNK